MKPHTRTLGQPFGPFCKLISLQPEQIEQVASWLLDEKLTYRDTAARVQEVFGFKVSPTSVHKFWYRECVPRKLQRAAEAAKSAQAIAAAMKKTDWQQANAQLIGQKIFETLSDPEMDIKTVCALGGVLEKVKTRGLHEKALKAKLATDKRRFEQKERQMALDREKFEFNAVEAVLEQAGKVKTISADRTLSSDEKREQLRRLLFPQAFADPPA